MKMIPFAMMAALLLAACPDPVGPTTPKDKYKPAYDVVKYGKFTVQSAHSIFKGVVSMKRDECSDKVCSKLHPDKSSQAYKDCMAKDQSAVAEFKTCFDKLGQADAIVDKAVPLAMSIFADIKDIIDLRVSYDIAKESVKLKKDPEALKTFCATVFPAKTGDEYDKCLKGDEDLAKFNWQAALKGRACTVYHGLAFVPSPYNKYTDPIRFWFQGAGGGCK
jgi:hypothetical protein